MIKIRVTREKDQRNPYYSPTDKHKYKKDYISK